MMLLNQKNRSPDGPLINLFLTDAYLVERRCSMEFLLTGGLYYYLRANQKAVA